MEPNTNLSKRLNQNMEYLSSVLPLKDSFDFMSRTLYFGESEAFWLGINGLCQNELLLHIFSDLQNCSYSKELSVHDIERYMNTKIGYVQASLCEDWPTIIRSILSGPSALFIDGFDSCILIDTRSYPNRGISEPDTEKVTRGAGDGFIESLVSNSALIRRRIRHPGLTFQLTNVGTESKTDVAVAYIKGKASPDVIEESLLRLKNLQVSTLTMGSKSLDELLVKRRWYNPMPCIFSTERPDVACSYISEGHVAILVDTSPSILILPCSFFQFTQAPEDYYKNLLVGNYIRMIRFLCIFIALFSLPAFMLIHRELSAVRLFVYVLLIELGLDLFKYSSAHAPSGFSGSLSIVGGLILSDSAIRLNWTSTEVIFYGAATMLATLTLAHVEFGEAIRLYRLLLILLTGLFGIYGFAAGIVCVLLSMATTPTFAGRSYFWPLFPWNWNALKKVLFRYPTPLAQPIKSNRKTDK